MKISPEQVYKYVKKGAKRVIPLVIAFYFIPKVTAVFFLIGLIDVSRNRPFNLGLLDRYFFGNGVLTWLIAPFNLMIDLITLPYRNRGIYQLEELPAGHQAEIVYLIETFKSSPEVIHKIGKFCESADRTMVFFKWYGKNYETRFEVPGLKRDFRFVKTIGISVFNKSSSTGLHFGPLRTTLRVLYNLSPIEGDDVYIQVGETINRWDQNPLFIFDDTLLHKSVNESEALRFCLFVDILRPGYVSALLSSFVVVTRFIFGRVNFLFYKNWQQLS